MRTSKQEQVFEMSLYVSFIAFLAIILFFVLEKSFKNSVLTKVKWNEVDLKTEMKKDYLKIIFIHPDLGIGGAENLVVNAAMAMKNMGHTVNIFTAHHDKNHAFEETKPNGELDGLVHVYGDWLPRTIFGLFYKWCTVVRMIYVTIIVCLTKRCDIVFCDQESVIVPILRFRGWPVLFYCHYPDKLLCVNRSTFLRRFYRNILDYIEVLTTTTADLVVVNSNFTLDVYKKSFKSLIDPLVLYPPINENKLIKPNLILKEKQDEIILLSINRFERKKNIGLAIDSFIALQKLVAPKIFSKIKLIIAGGYDSQNSENIEHLKELKNKVINLVFKSQIVFKPSISDVEKSDYLLRARFVLK